MSEAPVTAAPPPKSAKERFGSKLNPFAEKSNFAVTRSADFRRIAALPRRTTWDDVSKALTLAYALPPRPPNTCPPHCPCDGTGYMVLRPEQAWAIAEFFMQRGGVCTFGPGAGKTLISLIVPQILGWLRPVMFVPATLRDKALNTDIPLLSRHWKMHDNLEIHSFEALSRQNFADYLTLRRIPDGIMCDEVHYLKNPHSARTKRMNRFMNLYPNTEFVGMSGSPVHRSLMDYAHFLIWALKDSAPVPHSYIERQTWADCLDDTMPDWARPDPGALLDFCREGESPRSGYKRRLIEAPGFVSSPGLSTNVGLRVCEVPYPTIPPEVKNAFLRLRNHNEMPDGEVATTAMDQTRHARALFLGFYLRWVWPDGKRDVEWLKKRRAWRTFVRKMTSRSHDGYWLDTEAQVATAVRAGLIPCAEYEETATGSILRENVNVYEEWVEVRDERQARWGSRDPPTEAVWISDYMVLELERWAKNNKGIIWIENPALLEKMRSRGHVCFEAGNDEIEKETGNRSVFASFAHSVGKNCAMFSQMLFSNPLTSGKAWEQALGRSHRPKQKADEVIAEVYLGCRETWWSFERSRYDAKYIEATLGQEQRLNKATIVVTDEVKVGVRCDSGDPLWAMTKQAKLDGDPADAADVRARSLPLLTELRRQAKEGNKAAEKEVRSVEALDEEDESDGEVEDEDEVEVEDE